MTNWKLSSRAASVDVSGIRRAFDLGASLKDPIDLSIGQPAFDAFPEMKDATSEALTSGKSRYTQTQGILPLRERIARKYGFKLDAKSDYDIIVTGGVSGGFVLSYMSILDPGDEILLPDPFFGMYRDMAKLLNAVPLYYDTYPEFRLPLTEIESKITPKTKILVVNTPSNPTGVALTADEVSQSIELARKHDIWLLFDEIYRDFTFDAPHEQVLGRYEKILVMNGASKALGVPGWRIGYAIGSRPLIQAMIKVQQYSFVCAPSILQWGVLRGLDIDLASTIAEYKKKRDFICEALAGKYTFARPGGAFYLFPEAPGGSGQKFVERCIKESLIVVPGHCFSHRDTHFRISFSVTMDVLERGTEVLQKLG